MSRRSGTSYRPVRRAIAALIVCISMLPLSTGVASALSLTDVTQSVTNVQNAVSRIAASVQASIAAAQGAATALQANATAFSAQLQAIITDAPNDPSGVAAAIQAAVTSESGALEGTLLTQALALASKVAAPTCTALGTVTSLLPALPYPLDYSVFGPLAGPVRQLDRGVSDAMLQYYTQAFTTLLTPVTLPTQLAAAQGYVTLAQALLGLLKVNWHTTYYPTDGTPPVVRDTPAFLNLPMVLDVDGKTGYDMCGLMGLDLTSGAMTQSIARIPGSATVLPLDIQSQFLSGVISPGYETKGSQAPTVFDSSLTLAGAPVDTTVLQPGPVFTQTHNLTTALQYRWRSDKPPMHYTFASTKPGGTSGNGTQLNYTGNTASDRFGYTAVLASLNLGVAQTPGATSFEYCTSAKGFCSNEPATQSSTEKQSMHFKASQPVQVDQTSTAGSTTCPSLAILGDAHLSGSAFYLGADTTANPGHAWVDTDGGPVSGCLATASTTGTLPAGFTAQDRLVNWAGTGTPAPAISKTGAVNCPAGTTLTGGSAGLTFGLSRYLCAFPPVNTVPPTITGQTFQNSLLTANKGTWTPTAAPNAPVFTYQWQQCDGSNCTNLGGATAATYTATAADLGHTIRVLVTGTNADSSATAASAPTAVITLPPPPVNTAPPVITGIAGTGQTLTSTTGTWINAPAGFAYQWQLCDEDGTHCADIQDATGTTYVPSASDQGHQVRVIVTASNIGGIGTGTSAGVLIPPPPVSLTAPLIKNGTNPAAGANVFEGDHVSTTNGTWKYAGTFAYQWQRCDGAGANCVDIPGATGATYQAGHDDIASTLGVKVTATNPDGSADAFAVPTGQVLANALLPKTPSKVPDGSILAAAPSDHETSYVGGVFDTIGTIVGNAGAVPGTPAAASKNFSLAGLVKGGTVNAVASDTAGGYFLGGTFTSVLNASCNALAHITAAGALDPTYCQPGLTGEVRALDYVKRNVTIGASTPVDVLVVGGSFTLSDGHKNLAFLDNTGLASYATAGDPDGAVNAIADDSVANRPNFFVGGEFVNIGSTAARRLALVTIAAPPAAGTPMTLNGSIYPGGVDCGGGTCTAPTIRAIAFSTVSAAPAIFVGGTFDSVYVGTGTTRVARNNAAAFSEATAGNQAVGTWDPSPNGPIYSLAVSSATGTSVYLAGDFTSLTNGATVTSGFKGLAEYGVGSTFQTLSTWNIRPSTTATNTVNGSPNIVWKPQVDNGRVVTMLADTTTGLYVGGTFTSINGSTRHRLAQLSLPSAAAATLGAWDPNAGQAVRSLARYAPAAPALPSIFVGGDYLVLGGETRNNLAELTPAGDLTAWAPAGVNGPVRAVAVQAGSVYAGGLFTSAGGVGRSNLAAFDTASGATTGWNPGAGGPVNALAATGGLVYAGGLFNNAGGAVRANLAAIDGGGAATGWNPDTDGPVNAIAVSGSDVYVGGVFANAGGALRSALADIDAASGLATAWDPGVSGSVNALGVSADTVYVGGAFTAVGGNARSNAAGVDRATGAVTGWDPSADGAVRSLLVVGTRVFAGGDFASIGGVARAHGAQLDGTTAEATAFDPQPDGPVNAMTITPMGAVGLFGSFSTIAGGLVPTSGVAFYGG